MTDTYFYGVGRKDGSSVSHNAMAMVLLFALNDTLIDTLKEYATVFMQEKIIDKSLSSLFDNKIISFLADAVGLKDTLQDGLNPTYESITSFDSQVMYSIWDDFNTEINLSTRGVVGTDYVSVKYDPTLTQQAVEDIVKAGISQIPIIGELNFGVPKPGEVEHVALFETVDTGGYYRIIELRFNYGMFTDPSGSERAGPTYVELTVWKADWSDDPQLALGSRIEKHRSAPWI